MKALEEKILKDGHVAPGDILKVDSFVNHQIDVKFMNEIGKEFKKLYDGEKIDKILKNLDGSKSMPLDKIIYGLSINLIGQSVSKEISKIYPNMKAILEDLGAGVLPKKLLNIENYTLNT